MAKWLNTNSHVIHADVCFEGTPFWLVSHREHDSLIILAFPKTDTMPGLAEKTFRFQKLVW